MSTLLALVAALQALEAHGSMPEPTPHSDEYGDYEVTHPLVDECDGLANEYLITTEGHADFDAIRALKIHDYDVFCAERDSFGWLRGGITTSVGTIYYG